jgi:hypothetical protein
MPRPLKLLLVTPKIEIANEADEEPNHEAGGFASAVAAGDAEGQPGESGNRITLDFHPEKIGIQFHHKTDRVHNVYPGATRLGRSIVSRWPPSPAMLGPASSVSDRAAAMRYTKP